MTAIRKKILVAGATGHLGRELVQLLRRRGDWVRVIVRSKEHWNLLNLSADEVFVADITEKNSLAKSCEGIDAVISCAGASMDIKKLSDRKSFIEVDFHGNNHLLAASKQSGVQQFLYVSVAGSELLAQTEYCSAHWQFEQSLTQSGLDYSIIKPTGFFYFLTELLNMARQGRGIVFGTGESTTNPVHETDVAEACLQALDNRTNSITVGGPEVFSRKAIVELAFRIAGRTPSIFHVPPKLFSAMIGPLRLINPRIHALLEFGRVVSTTDVVVPSHGKRTLHEYFQSYHSRSVL